MKNLSENIKREIKLGSIKTNKLLIENIYECVWLFDLSNMCFKYINSIKYLMGLTVEEAIKEKNEYSSIIEYLIKISTTIEGRVHKFLDGDQSEESLFSIDEVEQYCRNGTTKTIEVSTKLIFNKKTRYVDILGVSRDITERKRNELRLSNEKEEVIRKLKKSEERLSRLADKLMRKNKYLKNIAFNDNLTGIYNRYFFDRKIIKEIEESNRNSIPLTLIFFDVDKFKSVNDVYGHYAGDDVLRKIAETGIKLMRKLDIFARWGGDEFVVLALQTNLEDGIIMAEKLRKSISLMSYHKLKQVTVSIGVAEKQKSESFKSLFKRADTALYSAKKNGGNCVVAD